MTSKNAKTQTQAVRRPIVPVVLSGGAGTRLWPLSREGYPKQFLPLLGELSLLQETLLRVADREVFDAPIVICAHEHRFIVAEQARQIGVTPAAIITEPFGRNTAPAVAVAAAYAEAHKPGSAILVMASDHKIDNRDALLRAFRTAAELESADHFVTFGAKPTYPATGYGYIRRGAAPIEKSGVYLVEAFVEKPDAATAKAYVESGDYAWNCGIFFFPSAAILKELEASAPDVARQATAALAAATKDLDFTRLDAEAFKTCPSISIDYAVMEKTSRAVVVPMDCDWSDLGSWPGVWKTGAKDKDGNVVIGDAVLQATKNCMVHGLKGKMTALLGVENVAVVVTEDAVLVASMAQAESVRALVEALRKQGCSEATEPYRTFRPWGWYENVARGDGFQVKHIFVHPGRSLSLQKHRRRAEHWVVVAGVAEVECDGVKKTVQTNESAFIPLGATHRLSNPGKIELHLVEVQSGDYLGEDDIIRLKDSFGRAV
ncbi:MAG: mannose-1-phosphate guanylyltransferase/mannose-6-phosphate isomerase [Alphaproteobacteria bacterium]|nr:mannose-1-phosphate guanylyltransferase/mannose-6-phosphate isomerase [Alphaproteobacteria bacterium]